MVSVRWALACVALTATACGGKVAGGGAPQDDDGVGDVECTASATDVCDGQDNDCDGSYDEDCACADGAVQSCGTDVGACVAGTQTCSGTTWGACLGVVAGANESCNGLDDNCDGTP